jgi:hypothetical protein
MRISKSIVDGVRNVVEPFLGEGMNGQLRAAMQSAIEQVLMGAKKDGRIKGFKPVQIIQTLDMEVAGQADVPLTFSPAFETRQVNVTVNVSKSS